MDTLVIPPTPTRVPLHDQVLLFIGYRFEYVDLSTVLWTPLATGNSCSSSQEKPKTSPLRLEDTLHAPITFCEILCYSSSNQDAYTRPPTAFIAESISNASNQDIVVLQTSLPSQVAILWRSNQDVFDTSRLSSEPPTVFPIAFLRALACRSSS